MDRRREGGKYTGIEVRMETGKEGGKVEERDRSREGGKEIRIEGGGEGVCTHTTSFPQPSPSSIDELRWYTKHDIQGRAIQPSLIILYIVFDATPLSLSN